jgi:hypothetical protein
LITYELDSAFSWEINLEVYEVGSNWSCADQKLLSNPERNGRKKSRGIAKNCGSGAQIQWVI